MRFLLSIIIGMASLACLAQISSNVNLNALNNNGDTINIIDMAKHEGRLFVIGINDWNYSCRDEMAAIYSNGIVDSCKNYHIKCVAITDERSHYLENIADTIAWKQKLLNDFELFISVENRFTAPSTIIIEPTGELSYYRTGHHRDKEMEILKDWIVYENHDTCKTCKGSGINPNRCGMCGGSGRCKVCEYWIDFWERNCPSCNNSRRCRICKGHGIKSKTCPTCTGIGKVVVK